MPRSHTIVALLFVTTGCGENRPNPAEPPPPCPLLLGINVRPGSATLAVGDSLQITARVMTYGGVPCTAIELDGPFEWSLSDSTIAQLRSSSGIVVARAAGQTRVIVRWLTDRNFAAAAELTVSPQ